MKKQEPHQRVVFPMEIHRIAASIKNKEKRSMVRGGLAKGRLSGGDVDAIRENNSPEDMTKIGAILRASRGLLDGGKNKNKKSSKDLFVLTTIEPVDSKRECCYAAGYIGALQDKAIRVLGYIKRLSDVDSRSPGESVEILLELAKEFGASNYLSYKLAYIRSAHKLTSDLNKKISEIEEEIRHKESPGFHFSALENLSPKLSFFLVAQKRVSPLVGRIGKNYRASIVLSNLVPTPISDRDASQYLLRATESSLVDTVYSFIVLFNLRDEFPDICEEFERNVNSSYMGEMNSAIEYISEKRRPKIVTPFYLSQVDLESPACDLYRLSSAFLEHKDYAIFRNKFDRVFGVRIISDIFEGNIPDIPVPAQGKEQLLLEASFVEEGPFVLPVDSFLRTYLFLRFIKHKANLIGISKDEIKFIFERTMELETLMTEKELDDLYCLVPDESKGLVSVLALALYRKKSIDPDVDFKFRSDLTRHVKSDFNGSIANFIDYLITDSPQVANYIVGSLDEVTLEKMYTLIKSASEASDVRRDVLTMVGKKLNSIEYIIEAESITTRSAISKLQNYFDSSRMYVDSVAMKKWLDSNPSISADLFQSLLSEVETSRNDKEYYLKLIGQREFLIHQIAKDAFEQFCLNPEFGIQSYLGRRIRHNTLDGVTTETVDAVFLKPEYAYAMTSQSRRRAVDAWRASYKSIIDRLRRDSLQFKPDGSLFRSAIDFNDSTTKENIRILTVSLGASGSAELLNDLVIAFCWRQIAPQLENAARHIKTNVLKEANASIEKHFSDSMSFTAELKAELHEAVNEVLRKVADWFQVPQTGFISASVRDLCQIILLDLNDRDFVDYVGDAIDKKYTGISVHRLYDCLVVLLQNASERREDGSRVRISAKVYNETLGSMLEGVEVEICSKVSVDDYANSKSRILTAIVSAETGVDMVTEGYSGLKKVKFITRASEGKTTVDCSFDDEPRIVRPRFSLRMEIATESSQMSS